jgi:hypothetical protein
MQGNVIQIDNEYQTILFDYLDINEIPSIIAHCDVHQWNKRSKPIIINQIKELAKKQTLPIFVVHDGKDKKHLKWITMCGFVYSGFSTHAWEKEEYMYIWRNK